MNFKDRKTYFKERKMNLKDSGTGGFTAPGLVIAFALIVGLLLLLPRVVSADGEFGFLAKWGELGIHDGEFNRPYGIAVDSSSGNIYVADTGNFRIRKSDLIGTHLDTWGSIWDDELKSTRGVAVDQQGSVYIVETYWTSDDGWVTYTHHSRVRKLSPDGSLIAQWGDTGTGNGQFLGPYDIATSPDGLYVYVADSFNHRIQKFTSNGIFLDKWGGFCDVERQGANACDGKFNYPAGITVDAAGDVFVSDSTNHRIQRFDSGGGFIEKWGGYCDVATEGLDACNGGFRYPIGLAIDSTGNMYVADAFNFRIQKFSPVSGQYEYDSKWGARCVVERDNPDTCEGDFNMPYGVDLDQNGNAYVADSHNHRIQKFGELTDPHTIPRPSPVLSPSRPRKAPPKVERQADHLSTSTRPKTVKVS